MNVNRISCLYARAALCAGALSLVISHAAVASDSPLQRPTLTVCADPSNLPYSDVHLQGFENKIAALIGTDLHEDVSYIWNEERRSFLRRTLLAHRCDVVMSVPAVLPILATTRPYFESTYVAVTRRNDPLHFTSFTDPALRSARIGLQLLGAEGANTPPAMALARSGFTEHITGFPMWADDDVPNPQGKIVDAVALGDIDVAFVWGPFGYYFAKSHGDALRITAIASDPTWPELAFSYPMAMGVRKDDLALRDRLQAAIDRHQSEIDVILHQYGLPASVVPGLPPVKKTSIVHINN